MKVNYGRIPEGQYGIGIEAIALLTQGISSAVGAGTGVASVLGQKKMQRRQLKSQERIARLQLATAERMGEQDRIVAARQQLLALQTNPIYQAMEAEERRKAGLLFGSLVAIVAITFLVSRRR